MTCRVNVEVSLLLAGPMDATDNSVEAADLEACGLDADALAVLVCEAIREHANEKPRRRAQPKPGKGDDYPLDEGQD